MPYEHQRAFYRIEYPGPARPTLTLGREQYPVVDCSESGLRYELPSSAPLPSTGTRLAGTLRFKRGQEVEVAGTVTRLYGDTVALRLEGKGIPFSFILDEQQYLRRNFLRHLVGEEEGQGDGAGGGAG